MMVFFFVWAAGSAHPLKHTTSNPIMHSTRAVIFVFRTGVLSEFPQPPNAQQASYKPPVKTPMRAPHPAAVIKSPGNKLRPGVGVG
ncbi:MAG: hypothetical protein ACJ754_18370 [Pyrinomonadaceae bacterium]